MLPWRGMKREFSRRNRLESGLSVSAVARSRGVSRATVHRSILMAKVRETKPDRRRPDQRDDVRRRPTTCAVWWWASPEDTRLPEARVARKLNNRRHARLQDQGEIRERLAADGRGDSGGQGGKVWAVRTEMDPTLVRQLGWRV